MRDMGIDQLILFKDLTPAQREQIRHLFSPCAMPTGVNLFEQGDQADFLFILLDGEVVVNFKPEDGPELTVARIHPQEVIGWSAALGSGSYTSSAICTQDCQMLRVRSEDLRRLYERKPETGVVVLECLAAGIADRLRSAQPQVLALLEKGMSARIQPKPPEDGL
jgi:CRP-like cAMP-binding protein